MKVLSNRNAYNILLILIILTGVFLRFFELGQNPPSLDWDEASLGYNAYSILKTGADEYGDRFPLSIRSFDDYKPPLYVYLTIPSVLIFGLNEFSTRFVSAFFGSLAILVTYLLVKELFRSSTLRLRSGRELEDRSSNEIQNTNSQKFSILNSQFSIPLLSAGLLAISPWHLQFSRTAFEANLGLFFFILGVYLLMRGFRNELFIIFSFLSFSLSIYSYHSFRLVVPLLLAGFIFYYRKQLLLLKKYLIIAILISGTLLSPIIYSFVGGEAGTSRFSSVTVLKPTGTLDRSIKQLQYDREKGDVIGEIFHNRRIVYFLTVAKGYFDHWNFDFLFLNGDGVERHHAANFGMLYLAESPFILIGIYYLIRNRGKSSFIIFWWFLVAPFASAITTGTPHPVRAIAMMPPLHIFTAVGLYAFFSYIQNRYEKHVLRRISLITIIIFIMVINFLYYIHQYYIHSPIEYSKSWQYGYKEMIEELKLIEDKYNKMIITYKYDQPYIFYLFYNKVDPLWYQKNWDYLGSGRIERDRRIFGKYEFRNINWGEDQKLLNTLIVGSPDEIPFGSKVIKEIKFLDGSVAFRIVES